VDSHRGAGGQKLENLLGLVAAEVIGNHVDLALGRLTLDDLG
jgi:hypothetical protein